MAEGLVNSSEIKQKLTNFDEALKIVQKAWKRVLEYRKELYKKRLRYNSLRHREIHGKWPKEYYWI